MGRCNINNEYNLVGSTSTYLISYTRGIIYAGGIVKALDKMINRIHDCSLDVVPSCTAGMSHEALCPCCNRFTGIEVPADSPPNGQHKCVSFCVWCGREFAYYY